MSCRSPFMAAPRDSHLTIIRKLGRREGFTLIELVVIIIILGIVAAVAIPKFGSLSTGAKQTATKEEMLRLKAALIGDASLTAGGKLIAKGYFNDVGATPTALADLVVKPASVAAYNKFTGLGWNGPYIDSSGGAYLTDAWGVAYTYSAASRTITSIGSGANIVVSF